MPDTTEIVKAAKLSDCQRYRYMLQRVWDEACDRDCTWIMLNPSTADAANDDPTIRRCMAFARRWGFGSITVLNLFAVRATKPADMLTADDPVGPDNHATCKIVFDRVMSRQIDPRRNPDIVVCAWGAHGYHMDMDRTMLGWLDAYGIEPRALGLTASGHPRHPLYVKSDAPLVKYQGRK